MLPYSLTQIVWTVNGAKMVRQFLQLLGVDCLFSLRVTEQIRFVTNFLLGFKLN